MLRFSTLHKLKRRRGGFHSDVSGSTVVEFALVAPVFLVFMFSTFEIGWFYFVNSAVDAAVGDAARMIKTGQVQKSSGTEEEKFDALYADICDVVDTFGDCSTRLTMEVDTYSSFTELAADNNPPTCADAPPDQVSAIPFEPGDELQIVRVRICYLYQTLNPVIGFAYTSSIDLSESSSNKRRVISTSIFRNEPYELNNRNET